MNAKKSEVVVAHLEEFIRLVIEDDDEPSVQTGADLEKGRQLMAIVLQAMSGDE